MSAIFEVLGIERMTYADGALRLGVLYDLLGRFHHLDMRDSTVAQFRRRYQVEGDQVERVEATALSALTQLAGGSPSESDVQFLSWACACMKSAFPWRTTPITSTAPILTYADMPGFSKKDQAQLAMLVLGHRGKLEKLGHATADSAWNLVFCLRLAVLLHRTRDDGLCRPGGCLRRPMVPDSTCRRTGWRQPLDRGGFGEEAASGSRSGVNMWSNPNREENRVSEPPRLHVESGRVVLSG
jgi:exopolyphosphatase/pppGpp-phosphohydrolase